MRTDEGKYDAISRYYEGFKNYADLYNHGIWKSYRSIAAEMVLSQSLGLDQLDVLDLGGGAMVSLPALLEDSRVRCYTIVDLTIGVLPISKKLHSIQTDILSFLRDSNQHLKFDIVIIFGVLEYLDHNESIEILSHLSRCIAPNGCLLVHEPNKRASRHLSNDRSAQHPVELQDLVGGTGLKVIERQDYHIILVRRIINLLRVRSQSLLKYVLALERWIGGGVDSVYLLKPTLPME